MFNGVTNKSNNGIHEAPIDTGNPNNINAGEGCTTDCLYNLFSCITDGIKSGFSSISNLFCPTDNSSLETINFDNPDLESAPLLLKRSEEIDLSDTGHRSETIETLPLINNLVFEDLIPIDTSTSPIIVKKPDAKEELPGTITPTTKGKIFKFDSDELVNKLKAMKSEKIDNDVFTRNYQAENATNPHGPKIEQFGISAAELEELIGTQINENELHPLEQHQLKEAIQKLNKRPSAEAWLKSSKGEYPDNAVVVDFFVRDKDGKIKEYENTKQPETHSTVLWKKKDGEIVLIDPSNTKFSERISKGITTYNLADGKTVSSPTSMELNGGVLYTPNTKSETIKARDCTDIAVKLSFAINEAQKENVALDDILSTATKHITNVKKVNDSLRFLDGTLNRELQSSEVNIRKSTREDIDTITNGRDVNKIKKTKGFEQVTKQDLLSYSSRDLSNLKQQLELNQQKK